jgi:hypothetical protein
VVLFYVLSPLPTLIARRYTENSGSSSTAAYELAMFITMGFVVSSFALPIVLARSPEHEPVVSLALLSFFNHKSNHKMMIITCHHFWPYLVGLGLKSLPRDWLT